MPGLRSIYIEEEKESHWRRSYL